MRAADSLRELVESVLANLPADATIGDLIEELEDWEAVEEAERDIEEGRVMSVEELRQRTSPCVTK